MGDVTHPAFAELLQTAVTQPGVISQAYSRFHNYSLGNVLLAWAQCHGRQIPLGPIATWPKWKELGRHVKKGEKAIALCQPVTIRRKADEGSTEQDKTFTKFTYRNAWFVLAQTEGADVSALELPNWDKARALAALDVQEIPFELIDGNVMGYAKARQIAVSPVNPRPYKTLFHEIAHVLLHTGELVQADDERTPRDIREVEAESVALLCCEALGLPGADEARGYIQGWYGTGNPIPEKSAQKILRTADQILRAGQPAKASEPTEDN